jgi:RHS repeat-associated protein
MDAVDGPGLQMQQRYYDPGIGRFLSVDPVTFYDNGDPRYFNRYRYAAGIRTALLIRTGKKLSLLVLEPKKWL